MPSLCPPLHLCFLSRLTPRACNKICRRYLAHPNHEKYLNKKIEMSDEMALVVGKDIATGAYAKSFVDLDLQTEIDSSPLDESDFEEVRKSKKTSVSSIPSSQKRSHRKRKRNYDAFDEGIQKLAIEVKEVALAIKNMNKNQLVVSDLYEEVMKTEGFDETTLATAFDYLVQNEMLAKAFMVKNENLQKIWVRNFVNQHGGGSAL